MVKTMTENPLKLSKSVTKKFCINKKKKSSYDNETKKGMQKLRWPIYVAISTHLNNSSIQKGFFRRHYGTQKFE